MECITLLRQAREAGLVVRADGDRLVVRGPRSAEALARTLLARKAELLPMLAAPYIDATGDLVIPFASDPKYHWWAGGQTVAATLTELDASQDVRARYVPAWSTAPQAEHQG